METKKHTSRVLTWILGAIALVLLLACAAMVLVTLLRPAPLPAETAPPTAAPTEPPTDPPTEPPTEPEPTLPPPEANPYGRLDFQYQGPYLRCREGESVIGIDVSTYQGEIDWKQVKDAGVSFVMIRLAYRGYETGKIVSDKYAQRNLKGAKDAGLDVGVYFFSQALTPDEAREEAQYVIDMLGDYELTMPVVFDWEKIDKETSRSALMDRRTLTDCALAFLQTIEDAGYWPMVYFNTHQSRNLLYLAELKDYDFWLALYSNRMTFPYKIKMWQYTCTGRIPGIDGDVDIDIFFPDL